MDKRQFLKVSGAFATTALLPGFSTAEQKKMTPRTNWSGNLTYHTENLFEPTTVAELQQVVKDHPSIRPLGTRHSFNGLADSTHAQVSLKNFKDIKLDEAAKAAAWAEVGDKLAAFESNGRFKGPCVMIAAVGRRQ